MVTATTPVLWPSCDVILPIVIVKLLRVLLEPALLVTSSLRWVGIIADSSAVVTGSSITVVSSISIVVVPISWSCEPGTLQIHTLSQGMTTLPVFGVFRAWTRQNLLCSWPAPLVPLRIVILASDPGVCIGH